MLLISFKQESPAKTLAAFLNNNQIASDYQCNNNVHEVHIRDEYHLAVAQRVAQEFVNNPNHPTFQQAAWENGSPTSINRTHSAAAVVRHLQQLLFSPVTASVLLLAMIIHLVVFGFGLVSLFDAMAFQPVSVIVENGEFWRLITPALMHFSALHIIFNLLWWWMLGKNIEKTLGSVMLLTLFFISGIASNYAQFLVSGPNFGGLSGVVYAVLGFVWWLGWLKPQLGLSVPKPIVGFMLIWLVLGYADIFWFSMANTAHTVGLVAGCLMARLLVWYINTKEPA